MAKFHGRVGFATQSETSPGVWEETIVEREIFGDVLNASFGNNQMSEVNDDLRLNNRISIIGNTFAIENFHLMKYVVYAGVKWRISNVEVQFPRLILTIGGIYNA